MNQIKLSYHQQKTIDVLLNGGKLFEFEDGTVGLDAYNGDTLKFRKSTFNKLKDLGLIKIVETPSLGCNIYGLV